MFKTLIKLSIGSFLLFAGANAQAAQCAGPVSGDPVVAEVVTFKLAEGVTEQAFLAAVQTMEKAYLCDAKGFVRRTLSKNEDGTWIDHVEWSSLEDAMAAMERSQSNQDVLPFLQSIAPDSIKFGHWMIAVQTK